MAILSITGAEIGLRRSTLHSLDRSHVDSSIANIDTLYRLTVNVHASTLFLGFFRLENFG